MRTTSSAGCKPNPDEKRLARLEPGGIIRRPSRRRLNEILREPPPAPEPGGEVLAALLDERRTSR